eukprot:scaffold8307_cov119-Isochrysis_galbana.AAC.9
MDETDCSPTLEAGAKVLCSLYICIHYHPPPQIHPMSSYATAQVLASPGIGTSPHIPAQHAKKKDKKKTLLHIHIHSRDLMMIQ